MILGVQNYVIIVCAVFHCEVHTCLAANAGSAIDTPSLKMLTLVLAPLNSATYACLTAVHANSKFYVSCMPPMIHYNDTASRIKLHDEM